MVHKIKSRDFSEPHGREHHSRDIQRGLQPTGENVQSSTSNQLVSASTAKEWARVDDPDGELDGLFDDMIQDATDAAQRYMNRTILDTTYRFFYDRFPNWSRPFDLRYPPFQSISQIVYYTEDSGQTTLSSSDYVATERARPRVWEATDKDWPTDDLTPEGVEIDAKMGYGDQVSDVPRGIRKGVLELVKTQWENPGATVQNGTSFDDILSGTSILDKYKVKNF